MMTAALEMHVACSWADIQSDHKHRYAYSIFLVMRFSTNANIISITRLEVQAPQIQAQEQTQEQVQAQSPQFNEQTQCQVQENHTEELVEHGRGQGDHPNSQAVVVRLRQCRLALLPGGTTDPASLCKEAADFDQMITSREWRGRFDTMKSLLGHFVVQYDKTDVDEAGIPRSVIGITEEILPWDNGAEKGGEKKSNETDREDTAPQKSTIQVNTSTPIQGKRSRASSLGSNSPRAKKHCEGLDWDDSDDSLDSDSDGDYDSDGDTDTDGDTDDEYDDPPDWSEYENGNEFTNKQFGSDHEPDEILDTRVDFAKIDIIPEKIYKALYESEDPLPKPRDYLIRGVPFPEMG